MATPCDGILECRDGSDENCEDDKWILVIAITLLFLTTFCIYLYLAFVRLPIWKNSIFRDFDGGNIDSKSKTFDCSGMKGDKLVKLKVCNVKHSFLNAIRFKSTFWSFLERYITKAMCWSIGCWRSFHQNQGQNFKVCLEKI